MTLTALLTLLMVILIIGVIIWGAKQLLPQVPMDPMFRTIAVVVIAIICIVVVFYYVVFPLLHAIPS